MLSYLDYITEASSSKILQLATTPGKTEELRDVINAKYKIKKQIPYIESKNPNGFIVEYNQLLKKYKKEFTLIFNEVPKGVGPGEVLLSYLSKNVTIGGGSATYDVTLARHKVEVKAVNIGSGFAYNFRLGVDTRPILQNAITQLKNLFNVAKYYIPAIDNAESVKKIERGEMTTLKKHLKTFDVNQAKGTEEVDIKILRNQDIMFQGTKIGNLKDSGALEQLKTMATTNYTKIKSYDEIEKELAKNMEAHKMSYFFFDIKKLELHFKERLNGAKIDAITSGTLKVKIPIV
jgi:hypothetical protein